MTESRNSIPGAGRGKNRHRLATAGICAALMILVFITFARIQSAGFVDYDDDIYVYHNPVVTHGITLYGIKRVFTHAEAGFYAPLTMLSHMMDVQVFGMSPPGHHFTSILIHALSSALLFLVLRELTGAAGRSAFVAAVFAVHPLHVESVAWVSERKDVLGGFFFMLTIGAYARYVRGEKSSEKSSRWYFAMVLFFLGGVLSKPSVVTLPFVLLLLDYWPLKRVGGDIAWKQLVVEKLPLFALAAVACFIAYHAEGDSVVSLGESSLGDRIGYALESYAIYIGQMFYPVGLVVFYPRHAGDLSLGNVAAAIVILAAISTAVYLQRRKSPYLTVGWLWYLGVLVPMIGLVQVGEFAHADRFTYLPQIGLYIAVAWGITDLCAMLGAHKVVPALWGAAVVCVLTVIGTIQASYWHDSQTLFRHALDYTSGNYVISNNLASVLLRNGDVEGAIAACSDGLRAREQSAPLHDNFGMALEQKGEADAAIYQYKRSLELDSSSPMAHYNLGNALFAKRDISGAIKEWSRAVELRDGYVEALSNLAWALCTSPDASLRDGRKASLLAQEANRLSDGMNPHVLYVVAAASAENGRFNEALDIAQKALQLALYQHDDRAAADLRKEIEVFKTNAPFRLGNEPTP